MVFLVSIVLITVVFGWQASKIQLSYKYANALPLDDPAYIEYEKFRQLYGEDGNVMVIGIADTNFYQLEKVKDWCDLTDTILTVKGIKAELLSKVDPDTIKGVKRVLSVTRLYNIIRNDSAGKLDFVPVLRSRPQTQAEVDSMKEVVTSLPFYNGLIFNKETGAQIMAITFDTSALNSERRIKIVEEIEALSLKFAEKHKVEMHFSGMPYIRTILMKKVRAEMTLFLVLAVIVVAVILFILFRSFSAVFFSIVVCLFGVVISVGTLQLMGYKITVLSGLIPPLILVIGVPNCIFIINKYQEELLRHGNKMKALSRTVEKVALSNFLANVTTAIGFGVFYFTHSALLVQFGIVAAINVMVTYAIAHILLPVIYSYLPAPKPRYTKHLKNPLVSRAMQTIDHLVHNYRKTIYLVLSIITAISIYGMTRIEIKGYVVDDLPRKDPVYEHLRFFEHNFHGVLPFEINVDTKARNGVFAGNARTLYKIKALQKTMSQYEAFSRPLSLVEGLKFAYQAYNHGNPKFYILPGSTELKKLSDYSGEVSGKDSMLTSFIDSTRRYTRVSFQMADVGSDSVKKLIDVIRPRVDSIFNYDEEAKAWAPDSARYDVALTGFSHVFLKSNDYLFHHLFVSLIIAIVLILIIGMFLFRSVAIIVLSKLPCLIPLAITAGIMGFMGIPFKPSTILIFSIAFGIASDGTIYILTEYRNQLKKTHENRSRAISRTLRELGTSMLYTNIILFFGFAIFAASTFGGTKAMGILISITLLVSLITNLVLMPSILLSLEKRLAIKAIMKEPLLEIYDEEEDIDPDKLTIQKTNESEEPDDTK
jgi:predicted RND superfamily exporter protein